LSRELAPSCAKCFINKLYLILLNSKILFDVIGLKFRGKKTNIPVDVILRCCDGTADRPMDWTSDPSNALHQNMLERVCVHVRKCLRPYYVPNKKCRLRYSRNLTWHDSPFTESVWKTLVSEVIEKVTLMSAPIRSKFSYD
jgi:hypothetical protein